MGRETDPAPGSENETKGLKRGGRRNRLLKGGISVLLFLLVWLTLPVFAQSRAVVIMTCYDIWQTGNSRLSEHAVVRLPHRDPLELESGSFHFLPVMNTFDASRGFSAWYGENMDLVIDYAVAAFDRGPMGFPNSYSSFYEKGHPLYNAYFGVYYLKGDRTLLEEDLAMAVTEYDIRYLALPAVGLSSNESVFRVKDVHMLGTVTLDSLEWTVYEAVLRSNGPEHRPRGFSPGYLQFGRPPARALDGPQYPEVDMYGRFYVTVLEENISIGLYGLASSQEVLTEMAETYLEKASLIRP